MRVSIESKMNCSADALTRMHQVMGLVDIRQRRQQKQDFGKVTAQRKSIGNTNGGCIIADQYFTSLRASKIVVGYLNGFASVKGNSGASLDRLELLSLWSLREARMVA